MAPDLLVYEVANVLLHHPTFPTGELAHALRTLYDLQMELIVPTPALVQTTIQLASRHDLTFYDALYVGVAQELDLALITADRHLQRRVAHLPFVQLLS